MLNVRNQLNSFRDVQTTDGTSYCASMLSTSCKYGIWNATTVEWHSF